MDEKQLRDFYTSINSHLRFLNDVSLKANGEETVKLINDTINKYSSSEFIKHCVSVINSISKNDFEFCKNLFEISCALVKYRRDPDGHEIVFTPLLLIRVRRGDCKKFTTWICAVLKCKGIQSASKVVNYDSDHGWQHIYAIAFYPNKKGYITLDPVNYEEFDQEVGYRIGRVNFYDGNKSRLIMTKLSIMGNVPEKNQTFLGIGEAADNILGDLEDISGMNRSFTPRHLHNLEQEYIGGISESICGDDDMSGLDEIGKKSKQQRVEKRASKKPEKKEKRKKIIKKAKKVGFAPVRAAFLVLIAAGGALAKHTPIKFNLAVKIAKLWQSDNGATMKGIWAKFGGKPDSLKNAIIKASNIQISGMDQIGSAAAVIASVTAAAPILGYVVKALVDKKIISKQDGSNTASLVEDIEHANTTPEGDLKPELLPMIKAALPVIDDAIKTDDGGDKAAQKVIKQTTTPNDQATTTTIPSQTFTSQSSSSASSGEDSQAAKTAAPTEDTTTTAAGFSLINASSWLTGSIQFPLGMNIICPGHEVVCTLLSSAMFTVSMYLFLNKYFKTKTIKP